MHVLVGAAMCSACLCGLVPWPLAIMLSADWVPVISTRSLGAVALVGCPDLMGRLAWVRYLFTALSNLVCRTSSPARLDCSYVATGCGARYFSLRAIIAQAIRAILLAKAMAATLIDRRSMSRTSQGWRV
jgi:hypothetical protein